MSKTLQAAVKWTDFPLIPPQVRRAYDRITSYFLDSDELPMKHYLLGRSKYADGQRIDLVPAQMQRFLEELRRDSDHADEFLQMLRKDEYIANAFVLASLLHFDKLRTSTGDLGDKMSNSVLRRHIREVLMKTLEFSHGVNDIDRKLAIRLALLHDFPEDCYRDVSGTFKSSDNVIEEFAPNTYEHLIKVTVFDPVAVNIVLDPYTKFPHFAILDYGKQGGNSLEKRAKWFTTWEHNVVEMSTEAVFVKLADIWSNSDDLPLNILKLYERLMILNTVLLRPDDEKYIDIVTEILRNRIAPVQDNAYGSENRIERLLESLDQLRMLYTCGDTPCEE